MFRILCEKSTSVLLPRVDKIIQIYCCSISSKKSNAHNKHKRTQNSIIYIDSIVSTPQTKAVSESNNTDHKKCLDSCGDTFSNEYSLHYDSDKKNLSDVEKEHFPKMYGANDANIFLDTEMNNDNISYKKGKKIKNHTDDGKKKFRHSRTYRCCAGKNTGGQVITDEKCPVDMADKSEQCKFNRKSLASIYTIYRKNKKNPAKLKNEPSYVGGMEMNENRNKMYNDAVEEQNMYKNKVIGKTYCCKLKNQTHNVREKMTNLYRVCSQKIIGQCRKIPISSINPTRTCPQGICRDAETDKYPNIYRENIKKCSDTCSTMKLYNKLQNKMKGKKHNYTKNMQFQTVEVQNEKDQTGEPLFEIKVDNIDMCVLNSAEIKDKVLSLGKEKKKDKCICPSHAAREKYLLKKEACVKGICKKMLKDKQTDFTCKCLKNKVITCTDTSCGIAGPGGTTVSTLNMKPLFEVQVDKDNMCIINPDEIRSKMKDIDKRLRKLCYQGICKNKSKDTHTRINCKCDKRRQIGECNERTCSTKRIKRNNHYRGNISGQYSIHPRTSFRNLRNKLTSMCSLVVSKSENYCSNCIKRRKRRQQRRQCNTMLCSTQSDNVYNKYIKNSIHRRTGLTINLKRKWSNSDFIHRNRIDKNEILNAAHADCCPCNIHNSKRHQVPQNRQTKIKKKRVELVSCIQRKRKKKKEFDCLNYQRREAELSLNDYSCVCDVKKPKQKNTVCPCNRESVPQHKIMSVDSTMQDNQKPKQRKGRTTCACIDLYDNENAKDFSLEQGKRNKRKKLQPLFVSADYTMQAIKKPKQKKRITIIRNDEKPIVFSSEQRKINRIVLPDSTKHVNQKPKQRKGKTMCTCIVTQDDKNSKLVKILARVAQAMSRKSICSCDDMNDSSKSKLWKNKIQYFLFAKKDNRNNTPSVQSKTLKKKRDTSLCKCHHICECKDVKLRAKSKANQQRQNKARKKDNKMKILGEREKRKRQEKLKRLGMRQKNKREEKMKSLQQLQKKKKMKMKSKEEHKRWLSESKMKRKQVLKERKKAIKEEKKRRKIQMKRDKEVLAALESEGGKQPNCCVVILESIFSLFFKSIGGIFYALFKLIISPVKSARYLQERFHDREGTLLIIKRKIADALHIRKLKIKKCLGNSETMSILSDTLQDTALFQSMMDKGKTKKDQERIELEGKKRKKRIKKRQEEALYGCRHSLLNTLRKTPCLWFYHVCPNMYPQCLSLVTFMRNFWHLCLFTFALACWTPCIVLFEIMRALCCCLLCTG